MVDIHSVALIIPLLVYIVLPWRTEAPGGRYRLSWLLTRAGWSYIAWLYSVLGI